MFHSSNNSRTGGMVDAGRIRTVRDVNDREDEEAYGNEYDVAKFKRTLSDYRLKQSGGLIISSRRGIEQMEGNGLSNAPSKDKRTWNESGNPATVVGRGGIGQNREKSRDSGMFYQVDGRSGPVMGSGSGGGRGAYMGHGWQGSGVTPGSLQARTAGPPPGNVQIPERTLRLLHKDTQRTSVHISAPGTHSHPMQEEGEMHGSKLDQFRRIRTLPLVIPPPYQAPTPEPSPAQRTSQQPFRQAGSPRQRSKVPPVSAPSALPRYSSWSRNNTNSTDGQAPHKSLSGRPDSQLPLLRAGTGPVPNTSGQKKPASAAVAYEALKGRDAKAASKPSPAPYSLPSGPGMGNASSNGIIPPHLHELLHKVPAGRAEGVPAPSMGTQRSAVSTQTLTGLHASPKIVIPAGGKMGFVKGKPYASNGFDPTSPNSVLHDGFRQEGQASARGVAAASGLTRSMTERKVKDEVARPFVVNRSTTFSGRSPRQSAEALGISRDARDGRWSRELTGGGNEGGGYVGDFGRGPRTGGQDLNEAGGELPDEEQGHRLEDEKAGAKLQRVQTLGGMVVRRQSEAEDEERGRAPPWRTPKTPKGVLPTSTFDADRMGEEGKERRPVLKRMQTEGAARQGGETGKRAAHGRPRLLVVRSLSGENLAHQKEERGLAKAADLKRTLTVGRMEAAGRKDGGKRGGEEDEEPTLRRVQTFGRNVAGERHQEEEEGEERVALRRVQTLGRLKSRGSHEDKEEEADEAFGRHTLQRVQTLGRTRSRGTWEGIEAEEEEEAPRFERSQTLRRGGGAHPDGRSIADADGQEEEGEDVEELPQAFDMARMLRRGESGSWMEEDPNGQMGAIRMGGEGRAGGRGPSRMWPADPSVSEWAREEKETEGPRLAGGAQQSGDRVLQGRAAGEGGWMQGSDAAAVLGPSAKRATEPGAGGGAGAVRASTGGGLSPGGREGRGPMGRQHLEEEEEEGEGWGGGDGEGSKEGGSRDEDEIPICAAWDGAHPGDSWQDLKSPREVGPSHPGSGNGSGREREPGEAPPPQEAPAQGHSQGAPVPASPRPPAVTACADEPRAGGDEQRPSEGEAVDSGGPAGAGPPASVRHVLRPIASLPQATPAAVPTAGTADSQTLPPGLSKPDLHMAAVDDDPEGFSFCAVSTPEPRAVGESEQRQGYDWPTETGGAAAASSSSEGVSGGEGAGAAEDGRPMAAKSAPAVVLPQVVECRRCAALLVISAEVMQTQGSGVHLLTCGQCLCTSSFTFIRESSASASASARSMVVKAT